MSYFSLVCLLGAPILSPCWIMLVFQVYKKDITSKGFAVLTRHFILWFVEGNFVSGHIATPSCANHSDALKKQESTTVSDRTYMHFKFSDNHIENLKRKR